MSDKTEIITTAPFRLAFPEVFKAKAFEEGAVPKYSITLLFPKDGSALVPGLPGDGMTAIRKIAYGALKSALGADKTKWPANLRAIDPRTYLSPTGQDGWPFRDGDASEWAGFKGMVYVRATSRFPPGVVDGKRNEILDESKVFGGLICRATVNAFTFDTKGKKGVSIGLGHIQILKDDGTLFGGQRAAEAFEEFGEAYAPEAVSGDGF